jgi:signal transduction histidine kinase
MKRLFLSIIAISVLIVSMLLGLFFSIDTSSRIRDSLFEDAKETLKSQFTVNVRAVRSDILENYTRGARNTLEGMMQESERASYTAFAIISKGKIVERSEKFSENAKEVLRIKIPVRFGEGGDLWGEVEFHTPLDRVERLATRFSKWNSRNIVIVSISLLIVTTSGLGVIFFSSVRLLPILVAFVQNDSLPIIGRMEAFVWQPLLSALKQASERISASRFKLEEARKHEAIARTTQMLAHDVRKPFSMLKMGLDMLAEARTPDEVQREVKSLLSEVERAMTSVNGMISDVMEIGSNSKPKLEPTSPESLIESTLGDIFRIYRGIEIGIKYDLKHLHLVNVDNLKVGR